MKEIPLTQGKVAIVDDEDYEWLSKWKWCYLNPGYAVRNTGPRLFRKKIYMHRLIAGTHDGEITDHIDRNKLNNQRSNLRHCTKAENRMNSKMNTNNSSGYKGVCLNKRGVWVAYIKNNKKQIHIGCYKNAETAARAYDQAARKLYGEFAKLNFS